MVKRRSHAAWGLELSRSLQRLTRTALRSGRRAAAAAAKPQRTPTRAVAGPPTRDRQGTVAGVAAFGTVVRRWKLYRPSALGPGAPLVVMLHGCGQDAAGFAAASRMNRVADREGFAVLYPEQDRLAHAGGCWHWYDTDNGRAQVEAGVLIAAIDMVVAGASIDPRRIAVAGLSAGAGMAALLAARHPARFAAVAMHSGVAPGAAHSTASAFAALRGQRSVQLPVGDLPALLVIQGDADIVVRPANGRGAALAWAAAVGATPSPPRTVRRGARLPMRISDHRRGGRLVVRLCEVERLGHAWSGGAAAQAHTDPTGPDASRMVWGFFAGAFAAGAG